MPTPEEQEAQKAADEQVNHDKLKSLSDEEKTRDIIRLRKENKERRLAFEDLETKFDVLNSKLTDAADKKKIEDGKAQELAAEYKIKNEALIKENNIFKDLYTKDLDSISENLTADQKVYLEKLPLSDRVGFAREMFGAKNDKMKHDKITPTSTSLEDQYQKALEKASSGMPQDMMALAIIEKKLLEQNKK